MKNKKKSLPHKLFFLLLTGCGVSALATHSGAMAAPPVLIRASVSTLGAEGNGSSEIPTISGNGRFVAFWSLATNLVPEDNNEAADIFLHDLKTGLTQRVSVSNSGAESNSGSLVPAALSANGRLVAFLTDATNLVAGDNNGQIDMFIRDLNTSTTMRISVDSAGNESNNSSFDPALSANGRFAAFTSDATNLVSGDTNGVRDVFVRDLKTGLTQRVSVDSTGVEGNGSSNVSVFSGNGRLVAFWSNASNLVVGDTNGVGDVFVHDLGTGVTQRVSVDSSGAEGNSTSNQPIFSANGRFVAFTSIATNLVSGDNNDSADVFVHDLVTGVTRRVSLTGAGTEGNSASFEPALSANGRFVAFMSLATNLVAEDDNNDTYDVFLRDLKTGITQRISQNGRGIEGNNPSSFPSVSFNGRSVAFQSVASNLVEGDHNDTYDVFVRR